MVDLGWDDAADVVVVGGGGAGMRAALAAAKRGVWGSMSEILLFQALIASSITAPAVAQSG